MQRIRKGDQVVVIAGRDRGTKGTVLARVDDRHVLVEGVNVVKKAVRPNPTLGIEGGTLNASELASQLAEEALPGDLRFPALLAAADRLGIQYIATGHHARVETDADGVSHLLPAADATSDESAALAALPQQTLARLILPLGDFSPDELSDLAEELQF